ncbi:Uncharacterised protein [Mycobacteroides abscessus subsp. abscessus]|nr:Uncharacterised protein [Mycobacteroides abscessus subsp. abscessus]
MTIIRFGELQAWPVLPMRVLKNVFALFATSAVSRRM